MTLIMNGTGSTGSEVRYLRQLFTGKKLTPGYNKNPECSQLTVF